MDSQECQLQTVRKWAAVWTPLHLSATTLSMVKAASLRRFIVWPSCPELLVFLSPHFNSECTGDQHFVFAIRSNSAKIPVNPTKLVIPKDTSCKPVIVNDQVAIFKFKVTECGTRSYVRWT